MSNKPLTAVVGATGQQGGSVISALLQSNEYAIKGLTRNTTSEAARKLQRRGVSMIRADLDDVESLKSAFSGAHAIFGTTDSVQHLHAGLTDDDVEKKEYAQAVNLANAAAATEGLEHYIWPTLPSSSAISGGKHRVAHFEPKARADSYILNHLPELAAKTTFLWVGYYPSNILGPALAPTLHATSGKNIWLSPVDPSTIIASAGAQGHNVGVFVRAILSQPSLTLPGRYVMMDAERISLGEQYGLWGRVKGHDVRVIRVSGEAFDALFPGWQGVRGMLEFWEKYGHDAWAKEGGVALTARDLGIIVGGLVDTETALRALV